MQKTVGEFIIDPIARSQLPHSSFDWKQKCMASANLTDPRDALVVGSYVKAGREQMRLA